MESTGSACALPAIASTDAVRHCCVYVGKAGAGGRLVIVGKDKGGRGERGEPDWICGAAGVEWRQAACLVALTTPHDYGTGQQQEYLQRSIDRIRAPGQNSSSIHGREKKKWQLGRSLRL